MKITLPLDIQDLTDFELTAQAEIVDVAPHLASVGTFAVHDFAGGYRITNVETGCALSACDSLWLDETLAKARSVLAKKTVNDLIRSTAYIDHA